MGRFRPYLAVISRESDAHDILGVVFETASGLAGAQVPQPQGLVPGAGKGEVSIRGEDDVGDEVAVTVEPLLGHTVVLLIASQLPDDQGLVPGGRQDHIRVFRVGGDLGDPAIVSFEGTAQRQRLSHVETEFFFREQAREQTERR